MNHRVEDVFMTKGSVMKRNRLTNHRPTWSLALQFVFMLALSGRVMHADAADFTLREHLGHTWTNERVTFSLTPAQTAKAEDNLALLGADEKEVPYQLVKDTNQNSSQISFQVDLSPYEESVYFFSTQKANTKTDLEVRDLAGGLVVENEFIGLAIRKTLKDGQGPIAGVRLRSGEWTAGSSLKSNAEVKEYSAEVTDRGPVFVEVLLQVKFADDGIWHTRFRIESGEPVVFVEEFHDAPTGGIFSLTLGGKEFLPTHMLNRDSRVESAEVRSDAIGNYFLEPWLHWNNANHGNWLALFTPPPVDQAKPEQPEFPRESATNSDVLEDLTNPKTNVAKEKPAEQGPPDKVNDMLVIGVMKPSLWVDPAWSGHAKQVGPNLKAAVQDGLLTLELPIQGGRRAWLLGALDWRKSAAILSEKNRRVAPPPQQLIIKHGDFPLDKVKDFVLDWKGDEDNHPVLHVRKQDLPELKKRLKSNPAEIRRWVSEQPINKYLLESPIQEFLASGNPQLGKRMADQAEEYLQTCVDWYIKQDYLHCPGTAPHMQSLIVSVLNLIDPVLSTEAFTEEQRKRVLAKLAFLGYVVSSPDYWSPERGYTGFANMTSMVALYRTGLGCMLPSHPKARVWSKQGLDQFQWQLYAWSDEDGGWLEAPHYAMVSLDHMIAGFSMAANAGFDDYAFDPRLRKVYEWFATISTPRDSRTGGFRHQPPIGNTYHGEPSGICGVAASVWKDRDPDFAARMLWMFEEGGSYGNLGIGWNFPSMLGYRWLMAQTGIEPKPADFGSNWFRNTGVVLRNQMNSDRETYLHMIAGSNHDHYDGDSGSIILYGKGRILCDDWGYIGRHPDRWHSMLTASSANGYGNLLVDAFAQSAAFDYVSGQKGSWRRQIAFSKDVDPLGPNFFLIRDTHDAEVPATWRLWLMANPHPEANASVPKTPEAKEDQSSEAVTELLGSDNKKSPKVQPGLVLNDHGATLVGGEDVDLDIFLYEPEKLTLKTETTTQRVSASYRDGREGPLSNTQTALVGTLPGKGTITALLYPRLKTEKPPTVTWNKKGNVVEVRTANGRDCLFMAPKGARKRVSSGLAALPSGDPIYDCRRYTAADNETPWVIFNDSGRDVSEKDPNAESVIRLAAGKVAVHPHPTQPATIVWQSPVNGTVTVEAAIADLNPGVNKQFPEKSDGVIAELRHGSASLARVAVPRDAEDTLTATDIRVARGDLLRLVIHANQSSWFDMTRVDIQVRSTDGRTWDLAESLRKGNKLGNDKPTPGAEPLWWACAGDAPQFDPVDLSPQPLPEYTSADGRIRFQGTAGAVQVRGNKVTMTLGAAGSVQVGSKKLTADGPASKTENQ